MIIYIDKSVGQVLHDEKFTDDYYVLFVGLANAHLKGKCFLCGDIGSLSFLSTRLEGVSAAIYRDLINHYSESRMIIESVEKIIVIGLGMTCELPAFVNSKACRINLSEKCDYEFDNVCSLIAENLDDCKFYMYIGQHYLNLLKLKGVHIRFQFENGAGSTISDVLKTRVLEDQKISLCIVDSDFKHGKTTKYPNSPGRGETANKLLRTERELRKQEEITPFEVYCLDVHEVENLIPISILEKLCLDCPPMNEGLDVLKELRVIRNGEPVFYYDLKKGIESSKTDLAYSAYWDEIIAESGVASNVSIHRTKVLRSALEILPLDYSVELECYMEKVWKIIGSKVYSWGCAKLPKRA